MRAQLLCVAGITFALFGCGSPEQREAHYLQNGRDFFDKGEYDRARVAFSNAGKLKPTDPEPVYRLGLVDEALADQFSAFNKFMAAATQDAHFAPAQLKLAEYLIASSRLDEAAERIGLVLGDNSRNAGAHALKATLELRLGDIHAADQEAALALAVDPQSLAAVAAMVGVKRAQKDADGIAQVLERARSAHPNSTALIYLAISAYESVQDVPHLEAAYAQIFKLAPPASEEHAHLAQTYTALGRLDDAEKTLRAGIAAAPDDWGLRRLLINFLAGQRGETAAETEIRLERAQFPTNRELPFWDAELELRFGKRATAEADLKTLSEQATDPSDTRRAEIMLAKIDLSSGHPASALALLGPVLAAAPTDRDGLFLRASIDFSLGINDRAADDLRAILINEPTANDARRLLAEVLLKQNHLDLAIDTLSQVIDRDPADLTALVRLAQLHQIAGNTAQSLKLLALAIRIAPTNAPAWESLARISEDSQDWDGAEKAIATLLTLNGQQSLAQFLEGRLLAARGEPVKALQNFVTVARAEQSTALAATAVDAIVELERRQKSLPAGLTLISGLPIDPGLKAASRGRIEFELGEFAAAIPDLDQAISAGSVRPELYIERASIAEQAGDRQRAIDLLNKGIQAVPADPDLEMLLAQLYRETGQIDAAITIYQTLLSRDAGIDAAANALAALIADYRFQDPGQLTNARTLAERFRNSENVSYIDTLAWVYYRQGAALDAVSLLDRATHIAPLDPVERYHYGAALLAIGRRDDARHELSEAIKGLGDHAVEVAEAKRLLATT